MLPRRKKTPKDRRPGVVPTDLPVFDALQDAGLVVVMNAKGGKQQAPPARKDRPRRK